MFRDWILSWKSLYLSIWPSTNPLSSPRLHFARNVEVWVRIQVVSLRFSKCCAVPTIKNFAKAGNLNSIHIEFEKLWQQLDREEATTNWKFAWKHGLLYNVRHRGTSVKSPDNVESNAFVNLDSSFSPILSLGSATNLLFADGHERATINPSHLTRNSKWRYTFLQRYPVAQTSTTWTLALKSPNGTKLSKYRIVYYHQDYQLYH